MLDGMFAKLCAFPETDRLRKDSAIDTCDLAGDFIPLNEATLIVAAPRLQSGVARGLQENSKRIKEFSTVTGRNQNCIPFIDQIIPERRQVRSYDRLAVVQAR